MKQILVVGDMQTLTGEKDKIDAFTDYLQQTLGSGFKVVSIFFDDIVFDIEKGVYRAHAPNLGIDLSKFDAMYLRGKRANEFFIAKFCAFNGILCINDYSNYYQGNKLAQTIMFLEADVEFLATIYSVNQKQLIHFAEEKFGYPYILKANKASHGDSNYLIRSLTEATDAIAQEPNADFIAQEFCPNECDYRLLLVGNKSLLFERKGGPDTHLNNTSKGGEAKPVELSVLPPTIHSQTRVLADTLGLKIAGFDIIPKLGTNEYYFLEINYQPQLRTGALITEKQQLVKALFETL